MKILFFANYLGGGFGHIGRCLALADEFSKRGSNSSFVLNGPHIKTVKDTGHEIHEIDTPRMQISKSGGEPYVFFSGMEYQILRDGFINKWIVSKALAEALKIIKKLKPEILIGDGYPLTYLLGKISGIPVVQFAKSVVHPKSKRMVWWADEPIGFLPPNPCPVFNPVLKKNRLPEITRGEDLMSGDLFILPSIPELDPMNPLPAQTHYVGAITRNRGSEGDVPEWFNSLDKGKPVIYVTVGGAAGNCGLGEFYQIINQALGNEDWQVVVSTGGKDISSLLKSVPSNIKYVRWIPGAAMIARSDLVIFHGGYTRIEILTNGVPSIVIPFHSEQEYYGRLMEKAGVSKVLHLSDDIYQRRLCYWKGGNRFRKSKAFSVHFRNSITLKPNTLKSMVENCLIDSTMKSRIQSIKEEFNNYQGAEKICDLIEDKFKIK